VKNALALGSRYVSGVRKCQCASEFPRWPAVLRHVAAD
jgi:hypothetical protein